MFFSLVLILVSILGVRVSAQSCPDQHSSNWNDMVDCFEASASDSMEYDPPSSDVISAWMDMIEDSLTSTDCPDISSTALSSIFSVTKIGTDICFVAETTPGATGYGTYVYRLDTDSRIHVQIPHVETEMYVEELGLGVFYGVSGGQIHSVLLAGVARDADGTDSDCQSDYKVADASHNTDNLFYKGTTVLAENEFLVYQFHGKSSCADTNLMYTSGTSSDSNYVDDLYETIERLYPSWIQWTYDQNPYEYGDEEFCSLTGTKNVEGRYINALYDSYEGLLVNPSDEYVCDTHQRTPSNFVHLELDSSTRQLTDEWIAIFEDLYSKYDFSTYSDPPSSPLPFMRPFTPKYNCMRSLASRTFRQSVILSGHSDCTGERRTEEEEEVIKRGDLFFIIRNKVMPFLTVGSKRVDLDDEDGEFLFLSDDNLLSFSLGLWGFYEYEKSTTIEEHDGFDPALGDEITRWYYTNLQNFNKTPGIGNTAIWKNIDQEHRMDNSLRDFHFVPQRFYRRIFPRFDFRAYVTSEEIEEPGRDLMKSMKLSPNGIKMSLNVTNSKCKDLERSDGIGFCFILVTPDGVSEETVIQNEEEEEDIIDETSDTNMVYKFLSESDDEYISFKKRLLALYDDDNIILKDVHIRKTISSDDIVMGSFLDVLSRIILKIRPSDKVDVIWISVDDCEIEGYFYDPGLGFEESFVTLDDVEEGDSGFISQLNLLWLLILLVL